MSFSRDKGLLAVSGERFTRLSCVLMPGQI
jgi:hypothetical protein